ncbi:MAG: hypothetical protein NTY23_00225 [Chloroflexi bacterium]|nr:hypothetical protein [Chloroflexota bacterium]
MKVLIIVIGAIFAIVVLGWLGLQIQPRSFALYPQRSPALQTVPLPAGLPAPVERFYRATYGENVPRIDTAVITGRGTIRLNGIVVPIRFRFTHEAGRNYRHHPQVTFFGLPLMKVNEYYIDRQERMELPTGIQENNSKLDQGGNLGMWAESPSCGCLAILVTDP